MGTVLFSYEFGAGLGHLTPLLAVAKRLSERHRLVFCLPDMDAASGVIARAVGERGEKRPVERWRLVEGGPKHSWTLADALYAAGFGDAEQVQARAALWREILAEVRPDLIISDFAPGLRLAAGGRPTVEVGYGYTVPPAGRLLPPLRPWDSRIPPATRAREFEMLVSVNTARRTLGGPRVDHLADLLQGDRTFVCTLAPFDMYDAYRTEPQLAPIMPRIPCGPSYEKRTGPEVFLYLHANHPRLVELLRALTLSGRQAAVYVSGTDAESVANRCGRNVAVFRRPADFATVLPQAKLSIHHGGLGSAHAGLAAGTPQLMFPSRLEWQVNAKAVETLGAGRRHRSEPDKDPEGLAALLSSLIDDPVLHGAARHASSLLQDTLNLDPLQTIVEACEWMLP